MKADPFVQLQQTHREHERFSNGCMVINTSYLMNNLKNKVF